MLQHDARPQDQQVSAHARLRSCHLLWTLAQQRSVLLGLRQRHAGVRLAPRCACGAGTRARRRGSSRRTCRLATPGTAASGTARPARTRARSRAAPSFELSVGGAPRVRMAYRCGCAPITRLLSSTRSPRPPVAASVAARSSALPSCVVASPRRRFGAIVFSFSCGVRPRRAVCDADVLFDAQTPLHPSALLRVLSGGPGFSARAVPRERGARFP